ncbi:MAG: MiaB/RimO family radical SAM methylthiotransferase, partial [Lachnospiraceae bacterium]|nr:MiaB/RimO family radical SAM methylthiotransferase [Lachnospiraceae bacterium]
MEVYFASLGCDKNLVDTEHMLSLLKEEGFSFSEDPETADALVVNTCCFILDAKQESINTILELAEYKKTGRAKALIVTGCLGERYREEIKESLPEVDRVVDIRSQKEIAGILKDALKVKEEAKKPKTGTAGRRVLTTPGQHSSFLKIAEGCDKACTYCIIPKLRGPYKSVPMEDLIAEAEELAAAGVKELNLVAQETGKYGIDLYGEKRLPRLLDRLNEVEGLRWIRLLYCYPEEVDDGLIEAILRNDKVCHYLDMPIQHASDRVLRAMGRKTGKQEIANTVRRLREKIPDICLRTTLI